MPIIKCQSLLCLHNDCGICGVSSETIIDINSDGLCSDNSPVTNEEYFSITGHERNINDTYSY